jgi:hypothetical protein
MIVTICINGGAGRVFTAIPALEKFVINHPNDQVAILIHGWTDLLFGHPVLEDLVHNSESIGSTNIILNSDVLIAPEPYTNIEYIKGNLSLGQTFDLLINGSFDNDEQKYISYFSSSKEEEIAAMDVIQAAKEHSGKNKVVVIQPFGSTATTTNHKAIIDPSSRSMELLSYYALIDSLKEKYALVYMGDLPVEEHITAKPKVNYRTWYSIIKECDYFIGVDSLGQHYAFSTGKPGTVIIGGTNPTNVTYPKHFNIYNKPNIKIKYSPIRLFNLGSYMADISNDKNMMYSEEDIYNMNENILFHIELNLKETDNECCNENKSNCPCD